MIMGRDKGFRGVGKRDSNGSRNFGEASPKDELNTDFEYPLGEEVVSLPLRESSLCNKLLSYACALLRYLSCTELLKVDLKGS